MLTSAEHELSLMGRPGGGGGICPELPLEVLTSTEHELLRMGLTLLVAAGAADLVALGVAADVAADVDARAVSIAGFFGACPGGG